MSNANSGGGGGGGGFQSMTLYEFHPATEVPHTDQSNVEYWVVSCGLMLLALLSSGLLRTRKN